MGEDSISRNLDAAAERLPWLAAQHVVMRRDERMHAAAGLANVLAARQELTSQEPNARSERFQLTIFERG